MTYNTIIKIAEKHNVDVEIYQDYHRGAVIVIIITYHGWPWNKKRTKRRIEAELNKQKTASTDVIVANNEINRPIHD